MFLRFLIFLILLHGPVYGLTVPLYGAYDFNQKQLAVFWNLPIEYDSYSIKVYGVVYSDRCDVEPQQTLINTYSAPITSKSFNLTSLGFKNTYNIEIFGVKGTATNRLVSQMFWIQLITPEFGVEWCLDDSAIPSYSWTGYKLYQSDIPSFVFNNSETLDDWKKKTFTKTLVYGTKINYLLTSAAKYSPSSDITESLPSAQFILYAVLPAKPIWNGLEN